MAVDYGDVSSGRGAICRANSLPLLKVKRSATVGLSLEHLTSIMNDCPISPTSPLSNLVRECAMRNPVVHQHHKLSFRNFDELHHEQDHSASRTPTPPGLRRGHSTSSLGDAGSKKSSRMPSKELPQKNSRVPSKEAPCSGEDLNRQNKDAVNWFHTTRAINKSIRTDEETEALLAAARLRRARGESDPDTRKGRAGSKQQPLPVTKDETEAIEEVAAVPDRRKSLDMAALWGAQPIKRPVPKAEQPTLTRTQSSSIRSDVQCGQEESLRSRLKRRATIM